MVSAQRNHSWELRDGQVVSRGGEGAARFVTAKRLTEHHDRELADLTGELNTLFMRHLTHEDGRELAILRTPDGLFLAWVRTQEDTTPGRNGEMERDVVGPDGADDAVRQALGLA